MSTVNLPPLPCIEFEKGQKPRPQVWFNVRDVNELRTQAVLADREAQCKARPAEPEVGVNQLTLRKPIAPHPHLHPRTFKAIEILLLADLIEAPTAIPGTGIPDLYYQINKAQLQLGFSYCEVGEFLLSMYRHHLGVRGLHYYSWLEKHTGLTLLDVPRNPVDVQYLTLLNRRWLAESIVLMDENNVACLAPPYIPDRPHIKARSVNPEFDRHAWGMSLAYAKTVEVA